MTVDERAGTTASISLLRGRNHSSKYKKVTYVLIGLLVVYAIARGVVGAAAKPFWFDELETLVIAGQPSVHGLARAVDSAFDAAPTFTWWSAQP